MIINFLSLPVVVLTFMSDLLAAQLIDPISLIDATTPELIRMFGYPSEVHDIVTEDGYILEGHRIPGKCFLNASLPPVLVAHGLFGCSSDFILAGPPNSLAFQLADQGYDVWLLNYRGNTYGRRNVHLTTDDEAFWDFSWHEFGYYDNVAFIDYILRKTGHEKVLYAGHSVGNTAMFVTCITRPEYNAKILTLAALGPVAYLKYITSPIRIFAPIAEEARDVLTPFNKGEFFSRGGPFVTILNYLCDIKTNEEVCSTLLYYIMGFDPTGFNSSLIPLIYGQNPAGSSLKTLVHYAQEIQSGNFQYFDYGPLRNLKYYDSIFPPKYNLSLVSAPTTLFYSDNDLFADPTDVKHLYSQLTNKKELILINSATFDHVDFIWGRNLKEMLNDNIMTLFYESCHEYRSSNCQKEAPKLPTWGVF